MGRALPLCDSEDLQVGGDVYEAAVGQGIDWNVGFNDYIIPLA